MTEPRIDMEAIRAVYERLPALECKGLCTVSCGPVPLTRGELAVLVESHGARDLRDAETCGYLDHDGRCEVYEDRPLICRLFGIVDHPQMTCPFGCAPERFLTNEEGHELLRTVMEAGGGMTTMGPAAARAVAAINALRKRE